MSDSAAVAPEPPPTSPEQLLAYLAGLGLEVATHAHPPVFTVEESRALRGDLPGAHCKNLFLKDKKGRFWLLVAREDTRVELNRLPAILGTARLSFAGADALWAKLGVRPGSVTPFALINDRPPQVGVVLEQRLLEEPLLNFHPLSNDKTTALTPEALSRFIASCGHQPRILALHAGRTEDPESKI